MNNDTPLKRFIKKIPGAKKLWSFLYPPYKRGPSDNRDTETIFTDIVKMNAWHGADSVSGTGSDDIQTQKIIKGLPELFKEFRIRSVLDIPCGDFHWMKKVDLEGIQYIGGDIVKEMVKNDSESYEKENVRFAHLDLIKDNLPKSDIILCRDCLVHLSFADIKKALKNICGSGSTYLLTTTFTDRKNNENIRTGKWRPLNFLLPPFNFPAPVKIINEECTEQDGKYSDKSLGLWKIEDIEKSLNRLSYFVEILRPVKRKTGVFLHSISKTYDRIYREFFPSATILLYHRVENASEDQHKLCVGKANFEEHIKYVSGNYRVISLHQLVSELKSGTLKRKTAVITFDDGYLDNMTNALPILEKYHVPATIFVTAGIIGKSPWWEGKMRIMNENELRTLSQNNLIEIGAHTMTHPHLSKQTYDEQERELRESKAILEKAAKKSVDHFAYPFGGENDFNEDSIKIAKKYYASACVNFYGTVKANTDIFKLPRINIGDWRIEKFKKEI